MAYNPYNPNQGYTGPGSGAPTTAPYIPPAAPTGTAGSFLSQLAGAQNSSDIQNPIMKNADGTWSVPETFMAGNRWSKGNINKDWATQFGGTYTANNQPKMTYVSQSGMGGGSWVPMSGKDGGTQPGTWKFNQDPTQFISNGTGASFQGGQGSNNSWKSAFKEIAPIAGIAAAPFAAAALAGAAGYGGGIAGMSGMGGLGGAAASGAGAALPAGAMQGMGGGLAAGASGVGGALAPAAGGLGGAAAAGGAGAGALGGGGLLSGSIPSMAGSATMGGSGIGAAGGTGFGAAGLTAPTAAQMAGGAASGGGGLSGLFGQAKDYASSLFGGGGSGGGGGLSSLFGGGGSGGGFDLGKGLLGLGQGYMQYKQGQNLQDYAKTAADLANPLKSPERMPYQDLLAKYYFGGQDITQQPMVKANLDFARNESDAKLARMGFSGSGNAATAAGDYTNKVFQANAMPYLNTLQGIAGFGMGPGNAGSLYQGGMTQASGANMQALGSAVGGFTSPSPDKNPWFSDANYSQNQMTQVPGGGTYQRMA